MASSLEVAVGVAVEVVIIAIAGGVLYSIWGKVFGAPQRRVILPFQRNSSSRQVEKTLEPGAHWISNKRTLLLCDMRATPFQVPVAELLTADGMSVRVSLAGEYRIANPSSFVTESSDAFAAFYLEVRQAVYAAVKELSGEMFIKEQSTITSRVKELLIPRASQLGIEIVHLEVLEGVPLGWVRQV